MITEGRWVGRWWEQACPRCLYVSQWAQKPTDARCASCCLVMSMAQATLSLSDLIADRDAWRKRALEAEHRCGDLEDQIHEARRSA